MNFFPSVIAFALVGLPAVAWADRNPDFEQDAKPILARQPGLTQYIHQHYVVKETGIAKIPGTESVPPQPPYIFSARPKGSSGPFYLRLLIQPGPAGHILNVADVRKVNGAVPPEESAPEVGSQPAPQENAPEQPAPAPAPATPPPSSSLSSVGASKSATSSSQPLTSDTPSGPISSSSSDSQNLNPPPDPAPANP